MAGKSRQSANLVSDNNIFVDIINDRVGIGTTIPTVKLDVNGNGNFNGNVTANSYYGDGSNLSGIGIGLSYKGETVGFGASIIDFKGTGISTITVSSGIATVTIEGGAGGGIAGINIQDEGTLVGSAVTVLNIVGARISAAATTGIATISLQIDTLPIGDYGNLDGTTDSFGIPLVDSFDCLTQPSGSLISYDFEVLT
jgi:hypothetical protein